MTALIDTRHTAALRRAALRATLAPSVHNTQPWRLRLVPGALELRADRTRQLAVLDPLEIREDRLLDQPVGSALETRCRVFQARAEKVVDFDAESRACHGGFVRRCEPGNMV